MEKIIFELNQVTMQFLDKEIFKIERLAVHQFDRIGIVGKNGTGKSTLLRLLAGKLQPTAGKIEQYVHPGYFEQLKGPSESPVEGELLSKLDISAVQGEGSGGEQTKLKLAQLFSNYYEALLLDEPTTHLDQHGISFLTEELQYYYGALILVSHDRTLLDKLVTTIWEVSDGKVRVFNGNYTAYEEQKQLELKQQKEAHENYLQEKQRLENVIEEKMQKAKNMIGKDKKAKQKAKEKPSRLGKSKSKGTSQKAIHRAAKSIEQRMEKLDKVDDINAGQQIIFRQSKALELHNKFPVMAENLHLAAGTKSLLENASFQFPLGKKIAITGANGSGKSTLLHHIANHGDGLIISPKAVFGLYQQMSYQFTEDETVIGFMKKKFTHNEGFLRSILHAMLFTGTDIQKQLTDLSGGEAIRLQLCQLFLDEYNILLLDEPTNFLDIQAQKALEEFMLGYQGTIIFISHDQTFIKNTADIRFNLSEGCLSLVES